MNNSFNKAGWFGVTSDELKLLFRFRRNPETTSKAILILIAMLLGPLTIAGALIGYARGYIRFMYPDNKLPTFHPMRPIVRLAMIFGAILMWLIVILATFIIFKYGEDIFGSAGIALAYLGGNLLTSGIIFFIFLQWKTGRHNLVLNSEKFASARYATKDELMRYLSKEGLFVGGDFAFNDKGHLMLIASTRSGKGTNLIIPNLMFLKNYTGNTVVVDIKAESAAITANYLRSIGKRVIILNPFDVLKESLYDKSSYNPLAILADSGHHLVDDVMLIAENLVPIRPNDHNEYFTTAGRQIIASILLHIVTCDKFKNPTLADLWWALRLPGDQWDNLLLDMAMCTDPVNGEAVRGAANEIVKMMGSPESWASCLSNALQATDIFKSSLLKEAMQNGFDPYTLTKDNNTVVFITIPVDKISSHSRYLRLVTTTLMRSIIRKPNPDVRTTFIVDEAFVQGYNTEFENCLATYAGMGVSLWLVYQDIPQLVATYGEHKWQSIIANCQIRIYSSIKDNYSANYISEAMGQTTRTYYTRGKFGFVGETEHIERALATPDEVKGLSRDNLILFAGENTFTTIPKKPYYTMPTLQGLYDRNPYIKDSQ